MGNLLSSNKNKLRFQPNVRFDAYLDEELVKYKYPWTKLVLSGGGVKAVSMLGAIKVLDIVGVLPQIDGFCGSSAGSLVALALALGYTVNEIVHLLVSTDFASLKDSDGGPLSDATRLVNEYGVSTGQKLFDFAGSLVKNKTGNEATTFGDLYKSNHKRLIITGCNLSTAETVYFSHSNTPAVELRLAIRISCSIPFVFTPVVYGLNHDLLCDGGILNNYALDVFDDEKTGSGAFKTGVETSQETLGIRFMSVGETQEQSARMSIKNVLQYGSTVVARMLEEIQRLHVSDVYWEHTIPIYTGNVNAIDFALSNGTKKDLYDAGVIAADKFLKDWVQKRSPRRKSWTSRLANHRIHQADAAVLALAVDKLKRLRERVARPKTDPARHRTARSYEETEFGIQVAPETPGRRERRVCSIERSALPDFHPELAGSSLAGSPPTKLLRVQESHSC